MNIKLFLLIMLVAAVIWYVVASLMIVSELSKRKQKIQFVLIRFMIPVYAQRYKKITLEETGHVGPLFYHWIISINIALVFTIAFIIAKFSG